MAEKKKSQTKTKKEVKKNSPKKKQSKKETKRIDSLMALKIVFCLLLILVIVLSVIVAKKKKEFSDKVSANIVITVVNKEDEAPFSINAKALKKEGQYIFRIANYKSTEINSEDLNYYIDIQNKSNCKISINKYGDKENLMTDQKETTIDGGKVVKNKKDSIYYVVKIISSDKINNKDQINVKIRAIKEEN